MNCTYCQKPVDPNSVHTLQRIEGWERKEKGGNRRGGSDIVLRKKLPIYACYECVGKLKRGLSSGQGTLV